MSGNLYLITVFAPVSAADAIRAAAAEAGGGRIGAYESCSFSSRGIGRFRPLSGSHPAIGTIAELNEVEEERIEFVVAADRKKEVVASIKKAHPYEEPAIYIIKLETA